jgi:hypothetical protein
MSSEIGRRSSPGQIPALSRQIAFVVQPCQLVVLRHMLNVLEPSFRFALMRAEATSGSADALMTACVHDEREDDLSTCIT